FIAHLREEEVAARTMVLGGCYLHPHEADEAVRKSCVAVRTIFILRPLVEALSPKVPFQVERELLFGALGFKDVSSGGKIKKLRFHVGGLANRAHILRRNRRQPRRCFRRKIGPDKYLWLSGASLDLRGRASGLSEHEHR